MDRVRIDKWLWAARFFKTRALATRACDLGRIQSNGIDAKPARPVQPGDTLRIKTEAHEYEIQVLALSEQRGPASVAQTLYQETPESIERRRLAAEEGILAHMNADHAHNLREYCRHVHGVEVLDAAMVGIDCDGFDVRADGHVLRVNFPEPVLDAEAARAALVELAKQARTTAPA